MQFKIFCSPASPREIAVVRSTYVNNIALRHAVHLLNTEYVRLDISVHIVNTSSTVVKSTTNWNVKTMTITGMWKRRHQLVYERKTMIGIRWNPPITHMTCALKKTFPLKSAQSTVCVEYNRVSNFPKKLISPPVKQFDKMQRIIF